MRRGDSVADDDDDDDNGDDSWVGFQCSNFPYCIGTYLKGNKNLKIISRQDIQLNILNLLAQRVNAFLRKLKTL